MQNNRPKLPQLKNVVFLKRVGHTLRQATSDVAKEELPQEILHLLRRLERIELRDKRRDSMSSR